MSKSTICHFSIEGEFVTQQARDFWLEGEYSRAFDLLDCMIGMTKDQQIDVLFGKKKLSGRDELNLVADDWTPPEYYKSFASAFMTGNDANELARYRENEAWEQARADFPGIRCNAGKAAKDGHSASFAKTVKLVGKEKADLIWETVMRDFNDSMRAASSYLSPSKNTDLYNDAHAQLTANAIAQGFDPALLPTADSMTNRGMNIKPVLDDKMASPQGWLLPDGKYYGCNTMEHVGLATVLLEEKHPTMGDMPGGYEAVAETYGWVKISKGILGLMVICKKNATKKQIAKLWDYSQYHNIDYEELTKFLINDFE